MKTRRDSRGLNHDPAFWQGAIDRKPAFESFLPAAAPGESAPVDFWFSFMVPTYNQNGPSCVGHSWANWIESVVRRYVDPIGIPPGRQIDGEAIWRRGRDLFWHGDKSGGLYLNQGFFAAQDLGWIPRDATVLQVRQDWDSINAALLKTPLVQGHRIHKGWFNEDRASGCIDHAPAPDGTGAHATLLMGTLLQPDKSGVMTRFRVSLNSWGADRGRFGFFLMTEAEWYEGTMTDSPWTAEIPNIQNWLSWQKGLAAK